MKSEDKRKILRLLYRLVHGSINPIGHLEGHGIFVVQLPPGKALTVKVWKRGKHSYRIYFKRNGNLFHVFQRPGGYPGRFPAPDPEKSFRNETSSIIKTEVYCRWRRYIDESSEYGMPTNIEYEDVNSTKIGYKEDRYDSRPFDDVVVEYILS